MARAKVSIRLAEAIGKAGIKPIDLAEKTGLTRASISGYLMDKYEPKVDAIKLMADALNVSPAWLSGFDVPMEIEQPAKNLYKADNLTLTIPFISQKLSAGPGADFLSDEDIEVKTIDIAAKLARGIADKSTLVAAEVVGDSMIGIHIYPGDIVVFSRGLIQAEGIYVVSFAGDVLVKRIFFDKLENKISIISENPKYETKTISADNDNFQILGKVLGWMHYEN